MNDLSENQEFLLAKKEEHVSPGESRLPSRTL